mmetsp:Transcript_10065/g.8583  ORF Transcript_10065/g.8583 Transcript_10065/m.8583 type:complete len:151 (-) Transcript_10065:7-459(-)
MDMMYNHLVLNPAKSEKDDYIEPLAKVARARDFKKEKTMKLRKRGLDLISRGKVGIVLLCGGEGSNLNFDHPKGTYNIGLHSQKSLFEIFADKLLRISELAKTTCGVTSRKPCLVRVYIMTNEKNHDEVISFFKQNRFFGLGIDTVSFFS